MKRGCRISALLAMVVAVAFGQTQLDLRTQSKSVDFSAASATKPFKTGTSLPASCNVGETFFKTNAAAGSNFYACTATNSWSLQGGAGAVSLGGDLSGSASAATVVQIQGRPVSSAMPTSGQALVWNSSRGDWEPQTVQSGGGGGGGASFTSQLGDLAVTRTSNGTISVAPPSNALVCGESSLIPGSTPGTISLNGSSAASGAVLWLSYDCNSRTLRADTNSNFTQANMTLSNVSFGLSNATGFQPGTIKIAQLTAGNSHVDQWDASPVAGDYRANFGTQLITSDSSGCITVAPQSSGADQIGFNPACVQVAGTATLGTSTISANSCAAAVSAAVGSAATTSVVDWSFASDPTSVAGYGGTGGLTIRAYATAGAANFRVCNASASAVTPGAMTINFRVLP